MMKVRFRASDFVIWHSSFAIPISDAPDLATRRKLVLFGDLAFFVTVELFLQLGLQVFVVRKRQRFLLRLDGCILLAPQELHSGQRIQNAWILAFGRFVGAGGQG